MVSFIFLSCFCPSQCFSFHPPDSTPTQSKSILCRVNAQDGCRPSSSRTARSKAEQPVGISTIPQPTLDAHMISALIIPAALFNPTFAKVGSCQVNETYLDLGIPIFLFRDALDLLCPTGHLDRAVTQLHLRFLPLLCSLVSQSGGFKLMPVRLKSY
ncbi:hypothetical protein F4604DRAFT_513608 [Suillus subluteus]|nr:hypothetical protein F4604DRAFT_513608 [Suillus subluteus]